MASVVMKNTKRRNSQGERGEGPGRKSSYGIGGELPQTKECLEPPENGKDKIDFSPGIQREHGFADTFTLDFSPPKLFENKIFL